MKNALQYGATVVQFPAPPLRDGDDSPQMVQVSALASDGTLYVYNKALHYRIARTLTYTQVSDAALAALRSFHALVDAGRHLFVWFDHSGQSYYSEDYYSEDYLDGGHNCRFTAPIKHIQTGANRHRVEIDLEELIPLAMPTTASWAAASAAVAGSFPCWIFRLTINNVDYWLSDHTFDVPGFCGPTLALVKSWGQIQSGVTGGLDEYKISDFSVDLLIDPDASPNLRTLANTYELEQYPVALYLWFHGLNAVTDPPRLKWKGYIRNHPEMDDTTLRLECENEAARFSKNIGTLLDVRSYPNADPKDVGKVISIVYGNVPKLPALGADVGKRTTLPIAITASAASFDLSDVTGLSTATIQIDDEQMQITSITGNTATVNRGINGTLASTHSRGAAVWEVKPEYIYIAAEAQDALSRVYGTIDDIPIDITSVVTRYTGQAGSQHPSGKYNGLAVVSLPGILTATQLDALGVARTGAAVKTGSAAKTGTATQTGQPSDPGHNHTGSQTNITQYGSNPNWSGSQGSVTVFTSFPALGAQVQSNYTVSVLVAGTGANGWDLYIGGVNLGYTSNGTRTFTATSGDAVQIDVVGRFQTNITSVNVYASNRSYTYIPQVSTAAAGVAVGSLAVSDSIGVADTVAVADTITPYLTGTATVRSIISHTILCDCTRNVYLPSAVEQDLLTRADGGTLTTVGTFPAWYRLDGAITEYKSAQYWLDYIAFQCRAWFIKERGTARLIVRPDVLTPVKTVTNCLLDGSKRSLKISKAPLSEVINVLALRYDRDHSQSRSAENYRGCLTDRMAESIQYYGEREPGQPEMFWFDFVRDYATAMHVMGYYLWKHSRRHRIYRFNLALDSEALQFADAITLGFEGSQRVEITAADLSPGDRSKLDTIATTATDIHTEWPYMAEDYYSEDYLLSNS